MAAMGWDFRRAMEPTIDAIANMLDLMGGGTGVAPTAYKENVGNAFFFLGSWLAAIPLTAVAATRTAFHTSFLAQSSSTAI